ncbi:MAG: hypothetical protein WBW81_06430 [Methylocella sp.]
MLYGKRPTNASVRMGSRAHANKSTASVNSGTAIQITLPMTAASTATAREIPIETVSLIFAIAVVLFFSPKRELQLQMVPAFH